MDGAPQDLQPIDPIFSKLQEDGSTAQLEWVSKMRYLNPILVSQFCAFMCHNLPSFKQFLGLVHHPPVALNLLVTDLVAIQCFDACGAPQEFLPCLEECGILERINNQLYRDMASWRPKSTQSRPGWSTIAETLVKMEKFTLNYLIPHLMEYAFDLRGENGTLRYPPGSFYFMMVPGLSSKQKRILFKKLEKDCLPQAVEYFSQDRTQEDLDHLATVVLHEVPSVAPFRHLGGISNLIKEQLIDRVINYCRQERWTSEDSAQMIFDAQPVVDALLATNTKISSSGVSELIQYHLKMKTVDRSLDWKLTPPLLIRFALLVEVIDPEAYPQIIDLLFQTQQEGFVRNNILNLKPLVSLLPILTPDQKTKFLDLMFTKHKMPEHKIFLLEVLKEFPEEKTYVLLECDQLPEFVGLLKSPPSGGLSPSQYDHIFNKLPHPFIQGRAITFRSLELWNQLIQQTTKLGRFHLLIPSFLHWATFFKDSWFRSLFVLSLVNHAPREFVHDILFKFIRKNIECFGPLDLDQFLSPPLSLTPNNISLIQKVHKQVIGHMTLKPLPDQVFQALFKWPLTPETFSETYPIEILDKAFNAMVLQSQSNGPNLPPCQDSLDLKDQIDIIGTIVHKYPQLNLEYINRLSKKLVELSSEVELTKTFPFLVEKLWFPVFSTLLKEEKLDVVTFLIQKSEHLVWCDDFFELLGEINISLPEDIQRILMRKKLQIMSYYDQRWRYGPCRWSKRSEFTVKHTSHVIPFFNESVKREFLETVISRIGNKKLWLRLAQMPKFCEFVPKELIPSLCVTNLKQFYRFLPQATGVVVSEDEQKDLLKKVEYEYGRRRKKHQGRFPTQKLVNVFPFLDEARKAALAKVVFESLGSKQKGVYDLLPLVDHVPLTYKNVSAMLPHVPPSIDFFQGLDRTRKNFYPIFALLHIQKLFDVPIDIFRLISLHFKNWEFQDMYLEYVLQHIPRYKAEKSYNGIISLFESPDVPDSFKPRAMELILKEEWLGGYEGRRWIEREHMIHVFRCYFSSKLNKERELCLRKILIDRMNLVGAPIIVMKKEKNWINQEIVKIHFYSEGKEEIYKVTLVDPQRLEGFCSDTWAMPSPLWSPSGVRPKITGRTNQFHQTS
jgi:hypothetical protein